MVSIPRRCRRAATREAMPLTTVTDVSAKPGGLSLSTDDLMVYSSVRSLSSLKVPACLARKAVFADCSSEQTHL